MQCRGSNFFSSSNTETVKKFVLFPDKSIKKTQFLGSLCDLDKILNSSLNPEALREGNSDMVTGTPGTEDKNPKSYCSHLMYFWNSDF